MKINAITILLLLFLTSCVTDYRSAQVRAVISLAEKGYAVEKLSHNPNIVLFNSLSDLNKKWSNDSGYDNHVLGFYSRKDNSVYFRKHSSFKTVKDVFLCYYLDQFGETFFEHKYR